MQNIEKNIEHLIKRGVSNIEIHREESIIKKWEEQLWEVSAIHNFRRQYMPESENPMGCANTHYLWYKQQIMSKGANIQEALLNMIKFLDKMDLYTPEYSELKEFFEL